MRKAVVGVLGAVANVAVELFLAVFLVACLAIFGLGMSTFGVLLHGG